jgi:sigma-B regulation protein RsbQ
MREHPMIFDASAAETLRLDGPLSRRHRARLIGESGPLTVFSHGLGTDQTIWMPLLERLPRIGRALLYDLPGAGPHLPYDFDPGSYQSVTSYADDLLLLLDEIGVTRCRYVGHSVSGMIGVLAAIEDPTRFERLILLNASPRYLDDPGYAGGFTEADLEALLDAMSANYQAWVAGFAPAAVAVAAPAAVREFSDGLLAMRPDVTVQIARMIFQTDVRDMLALSAVPITLIHSRNDIAVPESVARYLHDNLRGSELVWVEAAGHLPHLSQPGPVASILQHRLG